jgi:hypothetical protein
VGRKGGSARGRLFSIPSFQTLPDDYIGSIHKITAPPHGDVRPELFLPSPGQDPNGARVKRIGEEQAGKALPFLFPGEGRDPLVTGFRR